MVEFGEETVEAKVVAADALEALMLVAEEKGWLVETKEYDFGTLVEGINDQKNSADSAWMYFVNGELGQVAADQNQLKPGDVVEWKWR